MKNRDLLEKAIYWFKVIAEDAHRITTGNTSHSKPKFIEMDATKYYKFLEEHINDEEPDGVSMEIDADTEWDDIHKFLRQNLNGDKVKLIIAKQSK